MRKLSSLDLPCQDLLSPFDRMFHQVIRAVPSSSRTAYDGLYIAQGCQKAVHDRCSCIYHLTTHYGIKTISTSNLSTLVLNTATTTPSPLTTTTHSHSSPSTGSNKTIPRCFSCSTRASSSFSCLLVSYATMAKWYAPYMILT